MFDMLLLAFQTDSTRVATLLIAREGSNRSFDDIGIAEGHHDLTHHKNKPEIIEKVKQIDRWYVQRLARSSRRWRRRRNVDGQSLLHHSMILYGSGNADGNRHTHDNLPVVVAGSGGGTFKTGRYVKAESTPITNLYLSMADGMGAQGIEKHGDSHRPLLLVGADVQRAFDGVLGIARHGVIAPQPPHHVRKHRAQHRLPVFLNTPAVVHVVPFRGQRLFQSQVLQKPVLASVVGTIRAGRDCRCARPP